MPLPRPPPRQLLPPLHPHVHVVRSDLEVQLPKVVRGVLAEDLVNDALRHGATHRQRVGPVLRLQQESTQQACM